MKKYDCSKSKDLIHEYHRLCNDNLTCYSCPIFKAEWVTRCHMEKLGDAELKMIQKWSDEHPEKPKLTRKEYDFLTSFKCYPDRGYSYTVTRRSYNSYCTISLGLIDAALDKTMFTFIPPGESKSFEELLELEVEDE